MYATGSPWPRRRISSRIALSSAPSSTRSNCRYRSRRRSCRARAERSSASSRGLALPCSVRYAVLSLTTSRRVLAAGAASGRCTADRAVASALFEQPPSLILLGERLDEQVEVAVENAAQLVQGEVDAVVGDA